MKSPFVAAAAFLVVAAVAPQLSAAERLVHSWKKIRLTEHFWCEGAYYGDFNKDGKMDVVAGPYWWAGPDFTSRQEYRPATKSWSKKRADGTEEKIPGFKGALSKENDYSDNFFTFTHDLNGDGWTDILVLNWPGKDASWFENPTDKDVNGSGHWKKHLAFDVVDNESPQWLDLTGDGKPEIICNSGGHFGYIAPDWKEPTKPWTFHPITPKGKWERYTHGLGIGDVNGDGKADLLEANAWWEQPASLEGDPEWIQHRVAFAPGMGGAQMFAYDVNNDGRADVITSLAAHGYGLAWYEQLAEKDGNGSPKFEQHIIMNKTPAENKYGVAFSQLHAIDLVDMDGDGVKDIVTGKRFWAHGPTGDVAPNDPAVLYWFKVVRGSERSVDFVPHLIDDNSGVGTQVQAADINGDKLPDVVVGNKKGVFVHLHSIKKASQDEWEKAQPKPQGGTGAAGN